MDILQKIRTRAATKLQHIVLPEGADDRTLIAAAKVTEQRLARVTVLGDEEQIRIRAAALGVSLTNVPILDHRRSPDLDRYTQELYELRRAKGATLDETAKQALDPLYFGNLMVRAGKADGSVAGATNTTAHTVRSALITLGLQPGFSIVSSFILMVAAPISTPGIPEACMTQAIPSPRRIGPSCWAGLLLCQPMASVPSSMQRSSP